MAAAWSLAPGGLTLRVRVTPRGGRDAVDGLGAGDVPHLKLRVAAAPADGEANAAVTRLLAQWLGVPKSKVDVVSGATMRMKTIRVEGDPAALAARCAALVAA
jgi:uncharacterized protein YggU (UPF0235/DUF167 family)